MWAAGESRHSRKVPDRRLDALQGGDHTATRLHQLVRFDPEHIMPGAGCGPDLVVLQQVRVNEYAQLRGVTERWHAAFGFGIQCLSRDVSGQTRLIFPSWSL